MTERTVEQGGDLESTADDNPFDPFDLQNTRDSKLSDFLYPAWRQYIQPLSDKKFPIRSVVKITANAFEIPFETKKDKRKLMGEIRNLLARGMIIEEIEDKILTEEQILTFWAFFFYRSSWESDPRRATWKIM